MTKNAEASDPIMGSPSSLRLIFVMLVVVVSFTVWKSSKALLPMFDDSLSSEFGVAPTVQVKMAALSTAEEDSRHKSRPDDDDDGDGDGGGDKDDGNSGAVQKYEIPSDNSEDDDVDDDAKEGSRDGNGIGNDETETVIKKYDGDPRPWLIIHVGPPKTATTTIQQELLSSAKRLAKHDKFYFVGHAIFGHENDENNAVTIRVGGDEKDDLTIYSLRQMWNFSFIGDELKKRGAHGQNFVISAEQFSSRKLSWRKLYNGLFLNQQRDFGFGNDHDKTPNDSLDVYTEGVQPVLRFRIKIVVAYRHFFEWLPSLYHQSYVIKPVERQAMKHIHTHRPGIVDFVEDYLDRLIQYDPENNQTTIHTTSGFGPLQRGGMMIAHLPEVDGETSHGSVWAYLKWASRRHLYDRIDILDLHQQPLPKTNAKAKPDAHSDNANDEKKNDVFSNFVCQSLPSAPHTCRHLMKGNSGENVKQMRTGHSDEFASTPDKNRIAFVASQLNEKAKANANDNSNSTVSLLLSSYPHRSKIDSWFERAGLSANAFDNPRFYELKRCLGPKSTLRLKVASWNFLQQMVLLSRSHAASRNHLNESYYSSLFQSSMPTDHLLLSSQYKSKANENENENDDSWIVPTKAAHDQSFDEFVAKGKLCELRVEKLLEDEDFLKYVFGEEPP